MFKGIAAPVLKSSIVSADGWGAGTGTAFTGENRYPWALLREAGGDEACKLHLWFQLLIKLDTSVRFIQDILQRCLKKPTSERNVSAFRSPRFVLRE